MKRKTSLEQASCIAVRRVPYMERRFAAPPTNRNTPGSPPPRGGFARRSGVVKLPLVGEELRFEQVGRYRAGETEREVALGSVFLADVRSLRTGWARWRDDACVAIISGFVGSGFKAPARADLGDVDSARWDYPDFDPWQRFHTLVLVDIGAKKPFTFVASTPADASAVGSLAIAYGERGQALPVVRLRTIDRPQGTLRLRHPWFQIIGWTGGDEAPTPPLNSTLVV